jgi:cytochrome c oxidase cbb3-type subunit 4
MDIITFHSIYTVIMLAIFVGIFLWAWSGKQKKRFEEAANLPFADDEQEESSHGQDAVGGR